MFTAIEEKQILKLNDRLSREITIGLVDSEHPHYHAFKEFCDKLSRIIPAVKITKAGESSAQPPQIVIGGGLRYQAVPAGHELQPFLEALTAIGSDPPAIDESHINLVYCFAVHILPGRGSTAHTAAADRR